MENIRNEDFRTFEPSAALRAGSFRSGPAISGSLLSLRLPLCSNFRLPILFDGIEKGCVIREIFLDGRDVDLV
jgi:hypothetical protein